MPKDSPTPPTEGNRNATERPGWQRLGIRVGAAILLVLVVLFVGWLLGRAPVGDLRTQVQTLQQERDEAVGQAHANEALALIYRSVLDLDERNFGTANDRLDQAAALLGRVDATALGVSPEPLAELQQAIAAKDVRVAEDLDQQRAQLLGYARELIALTGATATP